MNVMNIGICKTLVLGLMGLTLSACSGFSGMNFGQSAKEDEPVETISAKMLGGQMTLRAPAGYCIDAETLTRKFAVIFPCKSNGHASHAFPATVFTASIDKNRGHAISADDFLTEPAKEPVKTFKYEGMTFAHSSVEGNSNAPATRILRSIAKVNDINVSIALYSDTSEDELSSLGRILAHEFIRASKIATKKANEPS